ncbi:MAG: hypothetical protein ABIO44_02255 [Saprospiraceae bacterium]
MKLSEKIIQVLKKQGDTSVSELTSQLEVSKQFIHTVLLKLIEEKKITKFGRSPKTIYRLAEPLDSDNYSDKIVLTSSEKAYLDHSFMLISEAGEIFKGQEALTIWCKQRKLPLEKSYHEFLITKKKYEKYYDELGLINSLEKLKSTQGIGKLALNDVYYVDFYAIERFGKTRIGTLLHFAKQGQSKSLMKIIVDEIRPRLEAFIKKNSFDAIAFVPPTIRRELQIMKYLETHLKINLPIVKIEKISGLIPVPQKSLSKLEERINNAKNTFAVKFSSQYKNLLLIDDALGSGTTLNEIAAKIKQKKIAGRVTGFAIVGSLKGFDVISDM